MPNPEVAPIYEALAAAQGEFGAVSRAGLNPHFKSRYATLADCMELARPILAKHKLALYHTTLDEDDAALTVVCHLHHAAGGALLSSLRVPVDKATAQGVASALTYGRRYTLCAMLGLVADDDDDGNAAEASHRPPPTVTVRRPAPTEKGSPTGEAVAALAVLDAIPVDSWSIVHQRGRYEAVGAPFEVKDALKATGFRWDKDVKVWFTPDGDKADGARAIPGCLSTTPAPLDQVPPALKSDADDSLPF
jgi:hypothetical protein